MATIVAQASGNWSNPATWTGGVVPGAGDIAQTGNYIVTVDVSVTCTLNPTGSGYFLVNTDGITITGDVVMQSSFTGGGLRCTHGSGTVALTGTATGGAGNYASGAYNNSTGTLTVGTATGGAGSYSYGAHNGAAGTLTVGTATAGAGNGAYGAYNAAAGTLTVGTATGGAGTNAYGAYNGAAGTLTIGTATAGAGTNAYGAYNYGAGTLTVDLAVGNGWGVGGSGGYAYGVYGSGATGQTTRVKRTQSGPYGAPAIGGAVLMLADASNSAQFRTAYGGGTLTLTDPSASADWPAESDVRAGVQYDNGDQTGTAHIPAAGSVALGIPVDATVGTAVLTAAGVTAGAWDAARSGHAGAGTFGATDEWAGSVDEAAIATATAAAILVTPANKLATDGDGAVTASSANVTMQQGVAVAAADVSGYINVLNVLGNVDGTVGEVTNLSLTGQQATRDAMKLAPTAGAPAAGSVDAKLDAGALEATAQAILLDTGTTLPAAIAGVGAGSAPTKEEIRAEIDASSTQLAAIKAKTDNLPSDPADQSELLAAIAGVGGVLNRIADDVDTIGTTVGALPTAAENADAVLDELLSGHTIPGSTGAGIATAGAAGDPWSTALPGAYGAGTAGALLSGIDSNVDMLLAIDTSTTDATTAGAISRRRGNSWAIPLTIGAITGYTSLWFTIKHGHDDADTAALVQIKKNASALLDGLLYVNGTTASSDALGSIAVNNATTGAIVIAVDETITDDLAPGEYYYDVQTLIAGDVATPDSGTFTVTADVTRSVT